MQLVFTPYSLRRIQQRGISKAEVQAVVDHRGKVIRRSLHGRGRKVHTASVGGRRISVVIGPGASNVNTVVTAWCPDAGEEE